MGMTVDEALAHAKEPAVFMASADIEETDLECMRVPAAEIERLQKVVADQALTIGTLRDTNAKLGEEIDELREELSDTGADEDWCREGQHELKRFTDREPKIDAIKQATIENLPKAVCELEAWEQEHPV